LNSKHTTLLALNELLIKAFRHSAARLLNNDVLKQVFSVSVKYFIDYNALKNKVGKRASRELILKNKAFFN